MASKVCDFCLNEYKGLFTGVEKLDDGHLVCKACRKKIESYNLPVAYDLFQILVTAEPNMREMIMTDYLESHSPEDTLHTFFPQDSITLHEGESLITKGPASICVRSSAIPASKAADSIASITRKDITNLSDVSENGTVINGTLVETNAALYFLSEHFINVHRLTNIAPVKEDLLHLHVIERGKQFTYTVDHADLWDMREDLFRLAAFSKKDRRNLIYLNSENTMTLTPGIYRVPGNVKPGIYFASPLDNTDMTVRDANGRTSSIRNGEVQLDNGSVVEVNGRYQLRVQKR